MRFRGTVAAVALACCSAAPAAPAIDRLLGSWTIIGVDLAPVTAVSADEAASKRGQIVVLGLKTANFADSICDTPTYSTMGLQGEAHVEVTCENGTIIPNFYIDRAGNVTARLDGATYSLKRR